MSRLKKTTFVSTCHTGGTEKRQFHYLIAPFSPEADCVRGCAVPLILGIAMKPRDCGAPRSPRDQLIIGIPQIRSPGAGKQNVAEGPFPYFV